MLCRDTDQQKKKSSIVRGGEDREGHKLMSELGQKFTAKQRAGRENGAVSKPVFFSQSTINCCPDSSLRLRKQTDFSWL